jgi:hypothetical protein
MAPIHSGFYSLAPIKGMNDSSTHGFILDQPLDRSIVELQIIIGKISMDGDNLEEDG